MNTAHRIADNLRSVVGYWTPTSTRSQFLEKGTLTAQEFVDAGDQLAFKFPTWQWQSADSRRKASWLPSSKQYLMTRNVPCRSRVCDLDQTLAKAQSDVDGWYLPGEDAPPEDSSITKLDFDQMSGAAHVASTLSGAPGLVEMYSGASADYIPAAKKRPGMASETGSASEANFNFQDIDGMLLEEQDPASSCPATRKAAEAYFIQPPPDSGVVRSRSYDLSITYDKFYQTPRIWLFGYDENGLPLGPDQIFQDVLSDYAAKTITVDPHPCTGVPTVSIHPCKHAAVMKKVVATWAEKNIEPRHDLALFVLLKFIASVIPTIDYDFTMNIDMAIMPSAG